MIGGVRVIEDGGPAFPSPGGLGDASLGMTLRDYFAAAALTGTMARHAPIAGDDVHNVAADCYAMADAFILQREVRDV